MISKCQIVFETLLFEFARKHFVRNSSELVLFEFVQKKFVRIRPKQFCSSSSENFLFEFSPKNVFEIFFTSLIPEVVFD
jgi:hypothetical protein